MPKVEDNQSADELYEKISSRINTPEPEKVPFYKQPWLVTSFSAAAVLIVLIAAVTWLSNGTYNTANEGDNADSAESSSESAEVQKDQSEEKQFSSNDSNTESNEDSESKASGNGSSQDNASTFNSDSNDSESKSNTPESEHNTESNDNNAGINSTEENQSDRNRSSSEPSEGSEEGNIASQKNNKSEEDSSNEANLTSQDQEENRKKEIGGHHKKELSYVTFERAHNQFATVSLIGKGSNAVVPITIMAPPNWGTVNEVYNSVARSVKAEKWGFQEYAFKDVTFNLQRDQNKVTVNFPKDYNLPQGKKEEQNFVKALQEMFRPHNIDKIILQRNGASGITFKTLGEMKAISIQELSGRAYLMYQNGESKEGFLAPKDLEKQTLENALDVMKQGISSDLIRPVIPNDVKIDQITKRDKTLQLNFSDDTSFGENPVAMLDAILMTAKSFGFKEVKFTNTPKKEYGYGRYQLNNPIPVPDLINPQSFSFPPGTAP